MKPNPSKTSQKSFHVQHVNCHYQLEWNLVKHFKNFQYNQKGTHPPSPSRNVKFKLQNSGTEQQSSARAQSLSLILESHLSNWRHAFLCTWRTNSWMLVQCGATIPDVLFSVFCFQAETEICSYIIIIVVLSNSTAYYFATFLKAEKCNFCNKTSFLLRPPSSSNTDNFSRL